MPAAACLRPQFYGHSKVENGRGVLQRRLPVLILSVIMAESNERTLCRSQSFCRSRCTYLLKVRWCWRCCSDSGASPHQRVEKPGVGGRGSCRRVRDNRFPAGGGRLLEFRERGAPRRSSAGPRSERHGEPASLDTATGGRRASAHLPSRE